MNIFGHNFRVSVFGESHGPSVGVMIDGCPPGIKISESEILSDLDRRRAGAKGTTPRHEYDKPLLISGFYQGYTTGAPIVMITENSNKKSEDYDKLLSVPRPGHADFTSRIKYKGFSDQRGGGHFSGRLTWGLVAAGTIARKIISPASVSASLIEAGGSTDITKALEDAITNNDSIGGIIHCKVSTLR